VGLKPIRQTGMQEVTGNVGANSSYSTVRWLSHIPRMSANG